MAKGSTASRSINLDTPVYSGKNVRSCWNYVLKHGHTVDDFFKDIDIPRTRLLDEDEWFTCEVIKKVYANYRSCLHDYNMHIDSYDISYQSVLDSSWGTSKVILQLLSPRAVYRLVTKIQNTFSKIDFTRCLHVGRQNAYIEYRRHDLFKQVMLDTSYTSAICGLLAAVPAIYGMPAAQVEELVSCLDIYQLFHSDLAGYDLTVTEKDGDVYLNGEIAGRRVVLGRNTRIDPLIDSALHDLEAVRWEKDIPLRTTGGRAFLAARRGDYFNLPFSIFRVRWRNPQATDRLKGAGRAAAAWLRAFFQSKNDLLEKAQKMQQYSSELEDRVRERTAALEAEVRSRIEAEEKLKHSLGEKEALLQEIHHRVKNNLQIISSLLDMTRYRAKDPGAQDALIGAKLKIQSMAQIHSQLYLARDFSRIDIEQQCAQLFAAIEKMYGQAADRNRGGAITLTTTSDGARVPTQYAIPAVLVLNELMTNSFKHAFRETVRGEIRVSTQRLPERRFEIEYRDNGCGIPADIDIGTAESLGLKLVRILVKNQLNGQLEIDGQAGTVITMRFDIGE